MKDNEGASALSMATKEIKSSNRIQVHRDCDCERCISHSTISSLLLQKGAVDEFSGGYASRKSYLERENYASWNFWEWWGVNSSSKDVKKCEYTDFDPELRNKILIGVSKEVKDNGFNLTLTTKTPSNYGNSFDTEKMDSDEENSWSLSHEPEPLVEETKEEAPQHAFHKQLMRGYTMYGDDEYFMC